jgi:subfamily B ATP-binding cassette protein MsbA
MIIGIVTAQIYFFKQGMGTMFVAVLLLHRTTQALFGVQSSWQQAMESVGSAEMVEGEMRRVAKHQEHRGGKHFGEFEHLLEFRNVSFAYDPSGGEVLRNANIKIRRNQTVALVGHSGAGKSTVADLITLLLRPTEGHILIDGQCARDIDPRTWRRQLGYVCQDTVMFDETVAVNICLSAKDYLEDDDCRRRVHAAAKQAYAAPFIEALPDGYETVVGDRGMRLSGGQRQRLFIARELYNQPRLLILDEATSALDGESEKVIQESIDALRGQVTVVVIAHRLSTIKNADYVYVLHEGEIIEHGSYEQLYEKENSRFRRMVEFQAL